MKISQSQAQEMENRGIAVLAGCAYVFNNNLDDSALAEVERMDFSEVRWLPECRLLTIEGPGNKLLLRFGWLDETQHLVRFKVAAGAPKFASLDLLRAHAYEPVEFITRQLPNPVKIVRKVKKNLSRTGLLVGDPETNYCSIISWDDGIFRVTDVEQRIAGSAGREMSVLSDVAAAESESVRANIGRALREYRPDHSSGLNANTQLAFIRVNPTF